METTRHFTATTYVVNGDATLLHEHKRLEKWLPPGGHIDRDELPHEAAVREVKEETGLDVDLVAERDDISSPAVEPLPQPQHLHLADVNVHDGEVGHQHVDLVFYARAEGREVDPADGEVGREDWAWFTREELDAMDELDADVVEIGSRAIEAVSEDAS